MTPLEILKADLCGQVEYRLTFPIAVNGYTLPVTDDDRAKFSQLTSAWTSARSLMTAEQDAAYLAQVVHIADANGAVHEMTRLAAYQLLLAYADAYYTKWIQTKEKLAAILAAPDEDSARGHL